MKKLILIFIAIFIMVVAPKIIATSTMIKNHQLQNTAQVVAFNTGKGVVKW